MERNSRKILKRLKDDGWIVDRVSGSHHVLVKEAIDYPIVLPHPKKDLSIGVVRDIYKKAGWT